MAYKPTVQELADLMGRSFSATQITAASVILDNATTLVGDFIRRPFEAGTATSERHVLVNDQFQVFLKKYPAVNVSSITVTSVDNTTTTTLDPYDYVIYRWGLGNIWNSADGEVMHITYTYSGLDSDQQSITKTVIFSAAQRMMGRVIADAPGLKRISAESTSYDFADDGTIGLTESEKQTLSRLRRRAGNR